MRSKDKHVSNLKVYYYGMKHRSIRIINSVLAQEMQGNWRLDAGNARKCKEIALAGVLWLCFVISKLDEMQLKLKNLIDQHSFTYTNGLYYIELK